MPTKTTETLWKKYMTMIRDIVFILLFLASIVGWIRSETAKKTKLETQVETLTEAVKSTNEQLIKVNEALSEQNILNGKVLQFMDMKK